ncbi:MAG: iron ABC transporter permease [Planctomycetes bacterium]|nr:iron ABC transporter permease [Planctomycetota bacterium]
MSEPLRWWHWLLLPAVLAAALLHLGTGDGPSLAAVLAQWLAPGGNPADAIDQYIVLQIRLPRLVVALCGGAALAMAGTVMQASFRNPLAAPDLVGTAAGAALGGVLAVVSQLADESVLATPLCSLAGAGAVTWLVFALAGSHGRISVAALLLAGVALNTLVGAVTAFAVTFTFANYTASSRLLFWLMGGLDGRTWEHAGITAIGCVLFAAAIAPKARALDLLTLRDDSAYSLGVDAPRVRRWLLWCACGLTACTVANTGGIAFVGLVVPHLARLLVGPLHRRLLPFAAGLGGLLLVGSDLTCQLAPPESNLPLGVVTALLGAPYFLFLLARHRRGEAL